jgi:kynurenine formamidase
MKTVSLKIDDSISGKTEENLLRIKKSQNKYINVAIDFYNQLQRRLILKKKLSFLIIIMILASCTQKKIETPEVLDFVNMLNKSQWIDLSYAFDENTVYWPTNVHFTHDTVFCGFTDKGYFYSSFKYAAEEHGGTHFDAPIHFSANKNTIEKVPLSQLKGIGVVVNVSEKALKNHDYLISVEDFKEWENRNGKIPDGAIVLVYTGYGQYYHNREKYLGTILTGPEAISELHFPGLSAEAAKWLTDKRNINAIGLDTPSIDYGQSKDFLAHRILCDNDLTIYENIANLEKLPETGSYIIALPMKIKGGSGAPLRIIAIVY